MFYGGDVVSPIRFSCFWGFMWLGGVCLICSNPRIMIFNFVSAHEPANPVPFFHSFVCVEYVAPSVVLLVMGYLLYERY